MQAKVESCLPKGQSGIQKINNLLSNEVVRGTTKKNPDSGWEEDLNQGPP